MPLGAAQQGRMKGVEVLGSRILLRPSEPEQSRRFYRDTLGLLAPGASEAAVVEAAQARGVGIYGITATVPPDPPTLPSWSSDLETSPSGQSSRALRRGPAHQGPPPVRRA